MCLFLLQSCSKEADMFELNGDKYSKDVEEIVSNGAGYKIFPKLFKFTKLKYLRLQNNEISTLKLKKSINSIELLDLKNNSLYDIESIKMLPALKYGYFSGNLIENIPDTSKNTKLEYFSIGNNVHRYSKNTNTSLKWISIIGPLDTLEWLEYYPSIETVELGGNHFSNL